MTHYYFGNCIYYAPALSDEPLSLIDLRTMTNVATGETEPNRTPAKRYGEWLPTLLSAGSGG